MNTHTHSSGMSQPTYSLVYISRCTQQWSSFEVSLLEDTCLRNNDSLGITGRLLYCRGLFLQLLEGPANAVVELINTIAADGRHQRVTSLLFVPAKRRYTEFRMQTEVVLREQFLSYAQRCLEDIGHHSPEKAEHILHLLLDYLSADEISLAACIEPLRRILGVKLFFKPSENEPARKTTHFDLLNEIQTIPVSYKP